MVAHPKAGQWDFHTRLACPRFLVAFLQSGFAPAERLSHAQAGPCRISPPALAGIRASFPTSSVGISQNPGEIWVDFPGKHSGSSKEAAYQLLAWEEQSPPCQEIAEAMGVAPAHWCPFHSSEPKGLHPPHSLGLPTLFQKAIRLWGL